MPTPGPLAEHDFQFLAALPTQPAPTPEHPGPYAAVKHVKNQEELDEERRLELAEEKAQRRIMERERMVRATCVAGYLACPCAYSPTHGCCNGYMRVWCGW